ncbi:Acylphosphatase [anaerobic digester metagenome]
MEKQYIIQVFGLVQGVGFRYFIYQKVQALGLRGFIKNMPDTSVYIESEGQTQS